MEKTGSNKNPVTRKSFSLQYGGSNLDGIQNYLFSGIEVELDKWVHLVIVNPSLGQPIFYIDGVKDNNAERSTTSSSEIVPIATKSLAGRISKL